MKSKVQLSKLSFKNSLLILVFALFSFSAVNAQWLVESNYVVTNIDACDTDGEAWHVQATATGSRTGNTFVITFPTGIGYASLVEVSALGITTTTAVGDNVVTITVPDMVANDVVEFNIFRRASCDAVVFNSTGGTFQDSLTINSSSTAFTHLSNDPLYGDGSYAINSPNVIVDSAVSTPTTANLGDVVTHTIVVVNQGQNSTVGNFHVNLDYTDFTLDPASVPAGGVLNAAGDRIDFDDLTLLTGDVADGAFEQGNSYTFTLTG